MKGMDCPKCGQQVLKLWEFFIFPSPFWLSKRCRNCSAKVGFDFNTVYQIILCFILAMLARGLIDRIVSFEFVLFDVVILIVFILIPFYRGKKLFLLKEEKL